MSLAHKQAHFLRDAPGFWVRVGPGSAGEQVHGELPFLDWWFFGYGGRMLPAPGLPTPGMVLA